MTTDTDCVIDKRGNNSAKINCPTVNMVQNNVIDNFISSVVRLKLFEISFMLGSSNDNGNTAKQYMSTKHNNGKLFCKILFIYKREDFIVILTSSY